MFLTENDLINAKITADSALNESEILKYVIKEDLDSLSKRKMEEGEKYYAYEHDILKKDFRQSRISETKDDGEGGEKEEIKNFFNPNRSNFHTINGFHRMLVDQKVSYLLGRKPVIKAVSEDRKKGDELEKVIERKCGEDFNSVLQELVIGASNKGFETLHVYYDEKGKLKFTVVPAEEVIPIYDSRYENELEQLIRYYDTVIIRNGQKYIRKRVEWWTKDDVTYYVEDNSRNFILDRSIGANPCPHWWGIYTEDGYEKTREAHGWGRVPFIILKNNLRGTTDLEGIKNLIDAYDLISSEGVNNLNDLVDLYWVIQGYGGETAAAIAKKLQINKAVHISDSGGAVEAKQTELSMDGRLQFMKMLRRDIFQFGQGVDIDLDRLGNSPSGVSLRYQYTLLDLKADSVASRLKKAIKELLRYIVEDYNNENGTDFDSNDLRVSLKKNMITNDYETVQMINMSSDLLSKETLLSKHPFVEEIGSEKYESGE